MKIFSDSYPNEKRVSLTFGTPSFFIDKTGLFFADKDIDRSTGKVPVLADLVFEETAVWFFHPLRQVGKEYKAWYVSVWQLCHILNLHVFAFMCWWWVILDDW